MFHLYQCNRLKLMPFEFDIVGPRVLDVRAGLASAGTVAFQIYLILYKKVA